MSNGKIADLINLGELDAALHRIDEIEGEIKCQLLIDIAKEYEKISSFEKSLEISEKAIIEASKQNYPLELLGATISKSLAHIRLYNYEQAKISLNDAFNLVDEIQKSDQNELFQSLHATLLNISGLYAKYQGELNEALEFYIMSLKIRRNLTNPDDIGKSLANISTIYQLKGELTDALEHNLEAMQIFMQSNNKMLIAYCLHDIGVTYRKKGDLDLAENFFLKALEAREELYNSDNLSETLFELVQLELEMNKIHLAERYFSKLQKLNEEHFSELINQRFLLSKASIIKTSNRFSSSAQAHKIFHSIANAKIINHELTVFALLNLLELQLYEYKLIKNDSILAEIQKISDILLDVAKKQKSYLLLAQIYLLLYRLAFMELDLEKAQVLLSQAEFIVQEHQLEKLILYIQEEQKSLNHKLDRYKQFLEQNLDYIETIEEANLQNSLEVLINQKNIDTSVLLASDKPVFILLLNQDGISMYSLNFDETVTINKALIGGFLMASNLGISNAIPGQKGSFESLKYGRYTLIFQKAQDITCCYAFIGPTHLAIQRLSKFLEKIQSDEKLWKLLHHKAIKPKQIALRIAPVEKEIFYN